jgi:peptidoglycan/LPS O-acetylase OafA/YrhL
MAFLSYILSWPIIYMSHAFMHRIDPMDKWLTVWVALQLTTTKGFAWAAMKLFDEPLRAWLTNLGPTGTRYR